MKYPEKFKVLSASTMKCMMVLSLILVPGYALAEDDIVTLCTQLEEQRALNQAQQLQLDKQAEMLEKMSRRLDEMTAEKADSAQVLAAAPQPAEPAATGKTTIPEGYSTRDPVGDLNRAAIETGDFPGAIKIPGNKDISLAIGGSIKTVAIAGVVGEMK